MSKTPTTFGAYAAKELMTAKATGRSFTKAELATFLDILLQYHIEHAPAVQPRTSPAYIAEAIYQAYPRKVGKKAALKAITAAMKQVDSIGPLDGHKSAAPYLLDCVKAYAAAVATWPASERQYIPHPATWFNRGSYLDDRKEWQAKGQRTAAPDQPRDYSKI